MMRIYFYDDNFRYIGSRLLEENEEIPSNATLEIISLKDGEEAHLVNDKWVISNVEISITEPSTPQPTLEDLATGLNEALVAIMQLSLE